MSEFITPRSQAMQRIREVTRGDLWLTSWALFHVLSDLDLVQLMRAYDAIEDAAEGRDAVPAPLRAVLEERWAVK